MLGMTCWLSWPYLFFLPLAHQALLGHYLGKFWVNTQGLQKLLLLPTFKQRQTFPPWRGFSPFSFPFMASQWRQWSFDNASKVEGRGGGGNANPIYGKERGERGERIPTLFFSFTARRKKSLSNWSRVWEERGGGGKREQEREEMLIFSVFFLPSFA